MMAKRWMAGTGVGLALAWNSCVLAQGVGLQVADTADNRTAGETEFTLGTVLATHMASTAGRAQVSVQDNFRVFADLGWSDPDTGRGNLAAQVGGLYALDLDLVSDLGIRLAGYYVDTDTVNLMGGDLMLLSSGELLLDGLFLYGGLGVDVADRETAISLTESSDHTEINPAVTIGALYRLTAHVSAYVEASHVDEGMIGFGVKYR